MCVCVCICHIFFIHSPDDKHLGCFNTLVAVNRAVMNVGVHVSFRVSVLLPLCCCLDIYPGVEFLGHGSSISNFLRNLQAVFHSDCTNLQSHLQWRKVPFSSHPCQHFFFNFLFCTGALPVNNVVIFSSEPQRDSSMHIPVCILSKISSYPGCHIEQSSMFLTNICYLCSFWW